MRSRSLLAVAAFCAALVLPGMAAAQSIAYAAPDGYTNLRSGPGTDYTIIGRVYPGSAVDVLGCLETRAWCDVIVQNIRGWMAASRLEFVYSGRRVLVPDYYTYFGAPYVIFQFGNDHSRRRSADNHSRRRSASEHDRWRSDNDHSRRRSRAGDTYKEGFHPPGGGDPGPEYVRPPRTENVPSNESLLGHPGGGGPGPERIRPGNDGGSTIEMPADGDGGGGCRPGQQECVETIQ